MADWNDHQSAGSEYWRKILIAQADEIQLLKEHESFELKTILQGTYNPNVKFLLPEGDPPYTPNEPQSIPSTLGKQLKKMLYFVAPKGNDVNKIKRETIFIVLQNGAA